MLVYHGVVPKVHEQLEEHGKSLDEAIKSILKEKLFAKLEEMTEKLLVPEAFDISFFDDRLSSNVVRPDVLAMDYDNRFNCLASLDGDNPLVVGQDGIICHQFPVFISTYPGIQLYRAAIDHVAIGMQEHKELTPLVCYVHEFAHYVNYCLSPMPLSVAKVAVGHFLMVRGFPIEDFMRRDDVRIDDPHTRNLFNLWTKVMGLEEANVIALQNEIFRRVGIEGTTLGFFEDGIDKQGTRTHYTAMQRFLQTNRYERISGWDKWIRSDVTFDANVYATLRANIVVKRNPITEKEE